MRIVNKKRFFGCIIGAVCIVSLTMLAVDFCRFAECYLPTWKYSLQNDIKNNNQEAIDFYENRYVRNGRDLFEDDFAIRNIYMKGEN